MAFVTQPIGRTITVDGAKLDVVVQGEHRPDSLIVSTTHPMESMHQAAPAIVSITGARVVSVNPRGVGGSSPPRRTVDSALETLADDLDAVRRVLGVARWVIWGMSGGSMVAQVYAHRHPRALLGLILDSAGPCFASTLQDPDCVMSPASPALREVLATRGLTADARASVDAGDPTWEELPGTGWALRLGSGPALLVAPSSPSAQMRRILPILLTFDARPWLGTIRVPTLVLGGAEDRIAPPVQLRALHEAIPGSDLVLIEGAGHVPLGEGRPEVAAAVRHFLDVRVKR
jgi:pimeloyl-ACP methyl ester carboxylesterase